MSIRDNAWTNPCLSVINMTKFFAAVCIYTSCALSLPALADSATANGSGARTSLHLLSAPKAIAGFFAGAIVGTPVCVVRKSIDEENDGIQGMVGNTDKARFKIPAGIFWLPFATVTGTLEA